MDVLEAVLRRSTSNDDDTPMHRIGRADYLAIPNKSAQGRPDRFFIDRTTATPKFFVWATSNLATDKVIYWRVRRQHDITAGGESVDTPRRWVPALTAALAYDLWGKLPADQRDQSRAGDLRARVASTFDAAKAEDRDRSSTFVYPDLTGYRV